MEKIHLENIDPRPKRRIHKDNPYRIFSTGRATDDPHYYIKFPDAQGVEICVEISKELFDYFDRCELEDISLLNETDRHADKTGPSAGYYSEVPGRKRTPCGDCDAAGQTAQTPSDALLGGYDISRNCSYGRVLASSNRAFTQESTGTRKNNFEKFSQRGLKKCF